MIWTTRPFFWHRLTWSAQVFSFFWYWRSLSSPWNPWSSLVWWFLPGLFLRRTKPNQPSQESPIVSIIILLDGYSCSDHFFFRIVSTVYSKWQMSQIWSKYFDLNSSFGLNFCWTTNLLTLPALIVHIFFGSHFLPFLSRFFNVFIAISCIHFC